MATLEIIFAGLTVISLIIAFWQHAVARHFPLHRREEPEASLPPVTLLKPLKGADSQNVSCLSSWLQQDYPAPVQVLFGVASAEDPVCPIIEKLQKQFPNVDIQLHIGTTSAIANPKVSTLVQLEPHITHSIIVISDADVAVPQDYLQQAVTTLLRESAGLVHSFYRTPDPANAPTAIEAIGTNCDMWTQVLQADSMRELNFALGAAMTLRQETLTATGGFTALGQHLADDNRLGALVHQMGEKIRFTRVTVECRSDTMNWRRFWDHQVRWNATIRACAAVPYFFSIIANLTLWAGAWVLAAHGAPRAWAGLGFCLVVRTATAAAHWKKLCAKPMTPKQLMLIPVKDIIQVVLWAAAFVVTTVDWRGSRFRICRGGKLEPIS